MPETQLLVPARRRVVAFMLAVGVVLGILVATGVTVTTPAFASEPGRTAVVGATLLTTDPAEAAAAVATAQTALTDAAATVADAQNSGLDLGVTSTAVDTGELVTSMDRLASTAHPSVLLLPVLKVTIEKQTQSVSTQTVAIRSRMDAAIAQKAAAEAAQAAVAALAAANTPEGAKAVAQQIAANEFGWGGDQFSCLSSLWQKESGWNYQAYNSDGGATGIPQALPGNKMASAGADWQTNAATQIRWGLDYIQRAYGSPCSAWGHSQAMNWY